MAALSKEEKGWAGWSTSEYGWPRLSKWGVGHFRGRLPALP